MILDVLIWISCQYFNATLNDGWRNLLGRASLNQSMTFRDSDVSAPAITHLHILAQVFTSDLVFSRAFTNVAIDMLPRVPSVLHSSLTDRFLYWMPPLAEWNIYQPAGFRSWRSINERIGQIGDRTTVFYLRCWVFFWRFWFFTRFSFDSWILKIQPLDLFGSDCPFESTWESSG